MQICINYYHTIKTDKKSCQINIFYEINLGYHIFMYQVFLFIIFPLFSVLLYSFNIEFTFYGIKIIKFFLQYKKFDLTSVSLMNPNAGHFIKFRIHNVQIIKVHCIVLFPIKSRHIKLRTKIVLFAILSHFNFFFKLNLNLFFLSHRFSTSVVKYF